MGLVRALEGVEFIGFDDDLPIRRAVDRFLRDHDVSVNVVMHFDNLQMIKKRLCWAAASALLRCA